MPKYTINFQALSPIMRLPSLQRGFFFFIALSWLVINWHGLKHYPMATSSMGIQYLWIAIIPTIIFFLHSFFLTWATWLTIFFLVIAGWLLELNDQLRFIKGNFYVKIDTIAAFQDLIIFISGLLVILFFLYLVRPMPKDKK